ncbi:MAG: phosphodiester glycosidase family protein [Bacillota bacterium]|nr:phosphodiester glycosidase family protein [Bacillota bacterium]
MKLPEKFFVLNWTKYLKKFLVLLGSIMLILVVNIILGVSLVRFNVFPNIKSFWVTTSMTTFTHQYLAKIVATDSEIEKILSENRVEDNNQVVDKSLISIKDDQVSLGGKLVATPIEDKVELVDFSTKEYKAHMFIVTNPRRIKLAVSKTLGKSGTKLNTLIKESNGIGGVNAGGFGDSGGHGNGGIPTGLVIKDGKVVWKDDKVNSYNIIGFDRDSVLILGNYTIDQMMKLGIQDGISFGPNLIVNGEPTKIVGDGGWGINPRTAIGQKPDGTILLLIIDGRQVSSVGATIREVQNIMLSYGAINAANLDGGASTVIYYNNKLINKPCSSYGERPLPNAWIITAPSQ